MPHRSYDKARLDELYPPLEACDVDEVEEPDDDVILNHGLEIVESMIRQIEDQGRRLVTRD